ncbi:MAG TPA: fused MFS/spermidine synthase, partial [Polyangiaceae bacterium]|nr:fused MFS/spermidine synthase [Polyangiaceae bacterium]
TLGLVVGVEVQATSLVVCSFFAGLALGGRWLGARIDRSPRPLRVYAALELASGVLGVATTLALSASAPTFVALRAVAGPFAWLPWLIGMMVPATLIGGTLPALLKAVCPSQTQIGSDAGLLYAANTAGAIAGVLATPFLLLPCFGVRGSALAAGFANFTVATIAWWLDVRTKPAKGTIGELRNEPPRVDEHSQIAVAGARRVLVLYAVSGGVALGLEVLWTQAIVQFLSTRAYAFAVVLSTYLSGLALGSFAYGRTVDRPNRRWGDFGLLVAGAGVTSVLALALVGPWLSTAQTALGKAVLSATDSRMSMMCARFALASGVLLLLPTFFLGAAYPAAMRLVARASTVARDSGRVAALNTAGGIVGSLVAGFVLLPVLGILRSVCLLGSLLAVVGLIAVLAGEASRRARALAIGFVAASVVGFLLVPRDKLARLLREERGGDLIFYEEATSGSVAVMEQHAPRGAFRRLYIQGVSNTGDAMASLRYMRLQALLPLFAVPVAPKSALVIGLGTGITCGALSTWDTLERRVCVELSPAVVRAAASFQGNFGVTRDPRFELRVADGRHALLASSERYDVITLEPPPPAAAGVVNLYAREFYQLSRTRLSEAGVLAQWWPLATQNDEDSRSLVQSMLEVFPHVSLFTTELHEMLLLGSLHPLSFDLGQLSARFDSPSVRQALTEVGVGSAEDLLATYVTDRHGLEAYVDGAPPVTDDDPRIEYAPWVRPGELTRVLPKLLERATLPHLDAEGAASATPRIEAKRQELYDFYLAGVSAMTGDRETWAQALTDVGPALQSNVYFDWFVHQGGRSQ